MAISNHERVGKALELLKAGLGPFVERELTNAFKERAQEALAYNALVQSWPEINRLAREGAVPRRAQAGLFEESEG